MLARVVVYARFHYLLEVNAAEDKFMHGSFAGVCVVKGRILDELRQKDGC